MTEALHLRRTLAAAPDRVWRALTDPQALCAWFWPHADFDTTAEVDLCVGGRYRIYAPRAAIGVTGTYVTLDPPRHLVMTWRWHGEDHETLVTIDLAAVAEGTELTLRHDRLADAAECDEHGQGWSHCLDRLPQQLAAEPDSVAV